MELHNSTHTKKILKGTGQTGKKLKKQGQQTGEKLTEKKFKM